MLQAEGLHGYVDPLSDDDDSGNDDNDDDNDSGDYNGRCYKRRTCMAMWTPLVMTVLVTMTMIMTTMMITAGVTSGGPAWLCGPGVPTAGDPGGSKHDA